jgi:cell division protein FtsN
MDDRPDLGLELVLDNRKLILLFAGLILVCGLFFVIGFMEGKRQRLVAADKPDEQQVADTAEPAAGGRPDQTETSAASGNVQEQLDWYKSVNKRGEPDASLVEPAKPAVEPAKSAPEPAKPATERAPPQVKPAGGKTVYAVQIGAFRKREEAEARAGALKSKGYPFYIEPPKAPEQFYLLKVGRFAAREDAQAMQSRLKKDGFATFIKPNP